MPDTSRELILYCDESIAKGEHFSNFYGGVLVSGIGARTITAAIATRRQELGLDGEVKWQKISTLYAERYIALMDTFFDFVAANQVKVRIMFTQNTIQPARLTSEQRDQAYFIFYYEFIKHAFGLMHRPAIIGHDTRVRFYLDDLPDTREKALRFRSYVTALSTNPAFRHAGLTIAAEDIAEVRSHKHDLLQCLDVVLGAMQFKLNDMDKRKPEGQRVRGARTRAKERVYKAIRSRIVQLRANFNIGVTTGIDEGPEDRWKQPYRHWCFRAKNAVVVGVSKRQSRKKQ